MQSPQSRRHIVDKRRDSPSSETVQKARGGIGERRNSRRHDIQCRRPHTYSHIVRRSCGHNHYIHGSDKDVQPSGCCVIAHNCSERLTASQILLVSREQRHRQRQRLCLRLRGSLLQPRGRGMAETNARLCERQCGICVRFFGKPLPEDNIHHSRSLVPAVS